MMWRTHVFLGVNALWLLAPLPGAITSNTVAPLCALAAFGALLPDLDAQESKIKSLSWGGVRPFAPVAFLAYRTWGHRAFLHSPLGLLVFAGVCVPIGLNWGLLPALALWLGYASHLAGDALTRTGIPGWPNRGDRRWYLLPERYRFVTGSAGEEALLPLLALPIVVLLLSRFPQ